MIYPYPSLWINGRDVSMRDIASRAAQSIDDFEQHTFKFIADWLEGKQTFDLHTSGSTGAPKVITVTRDQMIMSANMTAAAIGLKAGYTALISLNTQYIAGKMMVVRSLVTHMKMVAVTPSSNPFSKISPDITIDFAALVPLQVYDILASPAASRFNTLQAALIGGAALDQTASQKIQSYGCTLYATYGMTETISHIALQTLNGPGASTEFHTLPDVTIKTDHRYCLVIHAPHVSGPIITNDIVVVTSPTTFRWVGRWDNIINTGGVKVSPEVVEAVLANIFNSLQLSHPFFVGSLPDVKLGQKVILLIETDEWGQPDLPTLMEVIREKVKYFEAPRETYTLKRFSYTETGKINRSKTIEMVTKQP